MRAVLLKTYGGPDQLYIGDAECPLIKDTDVLVKIEATALNRADLLQREGKYPPPPGASKLLGLEMAGVIVEVGAAVQGHAVGDRVAALLAGGGYAEYVALPATMILPVPDGMSLLDAAAIPEAFLTAFQALYQLAQLQKGERVLIHAGGSGVGTAAIQLAKFFGASQIIITASAAKHQVCQTLGADLCIDYKHQNFKEIVLDRTAGKGVDIIIDFVGAPYFQANIDCMALDARMVMLAFLGGVKVNETKISAILRKRLRIMGSTLRPRSQAYKTELNAAFLHHCWPQFAGGALCPIIDKVFPWQEVAAAHEYMGNNKNTGKIVLTIN